MTGALRAWSSGAGPMQFIKKLKRKEKTTELGQGVALKYGLQRPCELANGSASALRFRSGGGVFPLSAVETRAVESRAGRAFCAAAGPGFPWW